MPWKFNLISIMETIDQQKVVCFVIDPKIVHVHIIIFVGLLPYAMAIELTDCMRFIYLLHVEYLRIVSIFHPGVQQREQYGHRLYISSLRPHAVIHAGYSCAFLDIRWSVCVSVCLPVIGVGTLTVAFDLHAWLLCTVMLGLSGTVSSLSR